MKKSLTLGLSCSARGVIVGTFLSLFTMTSSAKAATAKGDLFGGAESSNVLIRGSTTIYAYSEVVKPTPVGPNNSTEYTKDGVATVNPVPVIAGKTVVINSGIINKHYAAYTPVVGIEKDTKPVIPAGEDFAQQKVASSCVDLAGGHAGSFASFGTLSTILGKADGVQANAFLSLGSQAPDGTVAVGGAGSMANDPGFFDPGVYVYDDLSIDALLEIDRHGEVAGVSYYALDSRFTDVERFYDEDRLEPLEEALWALTLFVDHQPYSEADVLVDFRVNPSARAMGVLNPTLTDEQIRTAVADALVFSGDGSASLTGFRLFPTGTTFTVRPQDGQIEYAYATDAGVLGVPEPTAMTLIILPVVLLLLRRSRG